VKRARIVRIALYVLLAAFVVAQVVRPDRENPREDPARTLEATLHPPAEVVAILTRACADCHSSRTRWPWYTNVAPVSWWTAHHVKEGRREVSFSDWGAYSTRKQAHKLEEICEQVTDGGMPLSSYLVIHRDAKLSKDDVRVLCEWTTHEHERLAALAPPSTDANAAAPAAPAAAPQK
jgi:hypothetical protein